MSEWLTVAEAAKHLKVSRPTIFRWMRSGRLSFYKFGNATRFKREDIDQMAQKITAQEDALRAKQKCAVCGHAEFASGSVRSTGRIYFHPDKTRFFVPFESLVPLDAQVCTACGHVQLFADTERLARLIPEDK